MTPPGAGDDAPPADETPDADDIPDAAESSDGDSSDAGESPDVACSSGADDSPRADARDASGAADPTGEPATGRNDGPPDPGDAHDASPDGADDRFGTDAGDRSTIDSADRSTADSADRSAVDAGDRHDATANPTSPGEATPPGDAAANAPEPRDLADSSTPDASGAGSETPDATTADRTGPGWRTVGLDVASSAVSVLLVGGLLFAVSGVWPPMVAVESPSMTPHMKTGDLVFVMEADRFPGEGAHADTGVVTWRTGQSAAVDYRKFGRQGDVIVYNPDGDRSLTPIIHRAMFWVEAGENWYDEADRQAVGRYSECGDTPDEALPNCPAPHAGFITKGDANSAYDQAQGLSAPVRPSWVVGTAELRVPWLGCVRLRSQRCAPTLFGPAVPLAGAEANATNATLRSPV